MWRIPDGAPRFLGRAALLCLCLLLPWPGLRALHGALFRGVGNVLAAGWTYDGEGRIWLEPAAAKDRAPEQRSEAFDTFVWVENRHTGEKIRITTSSRREGYIPNAVFLAFACLSRPLARRRRAAFAAGLAAVELIVVAGTALPVLSQVADDRALGLSTAGPVTRAALAVSYRILLNWPAAEFVWPAFLWLVCVLVARRLEEEPPPDPQENARRRRR